MEMLENLKDIFSALKMKKDGTLKLDEKSFIMDRLNEAIVEIAKNSKEYRENKRHINATKLQAAFREVLYTKK
jgi:hypothetical protein